MRKTKKGIMVLLALLLLFLTACSSTDTASDPSGDSPDSSAGENSGQDAGQKADGDNPPDPFGKYEETVTIRIGQEVDPSDTSLPPGDTPLDNQYTRHVKENLNIEVEHAFTASPANYDQKVSLAIASNDLPDAMIVGPVELRQMYEAGQLEDLTDVYEQYASPAIKRIIESTNGLGAGSGHLRRTHHGDPECPVAGGRRALAVDSQGLAG